jgi:hypothetical protein
LHDKGVSNVLVKELYILLRVFICPLSKNPLGSVRAIEAAEP